MEKSDELRMHDSGMNLCEIPFLGRENVWDQNKMEYFILSYDAYIWRLL